MVIKMQNFRSPKSNKAYLHYIESALIIALFVIKAYFLYEYIGYGKYSIVFAAMTAGALFGLNALISIISDKGAATWTLLAIYFLFSVIMFADRMYFSYYHKLPGVAVLGMMGMLGGVKSSVYELLDFSHVLYLADLPVLAVYFIAARRYILRHTKSVAAARKASRINRIASASVFFLLVAVVAVTIKLTDLKLENISGELFVYHFTDVLSVMVGDRFSGGADTNEYVQASAEAESDPYYGLAKGRNLIIVQVESLQGFVIGNDFYGSEITPNLNALIKHDSFYFPNYYYVVGAGNTSDAEFAVNNSLYPPTDLAAYIKYTDKKYYGLPFVLKDNGYKSAMVFHGYLREYWNRDKAYPYQGFDEYYSQESFSSDHIIGLGVSDERFFRESVEVLRAKEQPFYAFMITLSSHHPYWLPREDRRLPVPDELDNTLFANYFVAINYVDYAIGCLIEELKAAGLYDNSMIVIYGDHYGMTNDEENYSLASQYFGHLYYEGDLFRVPMIIHIPGSGVSMTVDRPSSHVDVMPTVLHLLGIRNEGGVMFGHNMLSDDETPVYLQMHVKRGSFVTKDILFVYPTNGIISDAKCFDLKAHKRIDDGTAAFAERYAEQYTTAQKVIQDCISIIEADRIRVKP